MNRAFALFGLGCGGLILLFVFAAVLFGGWYMSVNNKDASLRALAAAEQDNSKIVYDETWKVISEQAQVPDAYKTDFREVWATIVNGNSAQSKSAFSAFVTQYNPQFDSGLYAKLMTTIEHKRKEFTQAQRKLRDVKREHDQFRTKMPVNSAVGRAIFGEFKEIEVQLVLSDKTADAFQAGKDGQIDVFGRKKDGVK